MPRGAARLALLKLRLLGMQRTLRAAVEAEQAELAAAPERRYALLRNAAKRQKIETARKVGRRAVAPVIFACGPPPPPALAPRPSLTPALYVLVSPPLLTPALSLFLPAAV
jgi:hypothetical protein